jgi:cysteine synthase
VIRPSATRPVHDDTRTRRLKGLRSMVGDTPLVSVRLRYRGRECRVHAKAEYLNLTGSIKDRMAFHICRTAIEQEALGPDDTIVEATSGNTGISLAMIAAVRGYRCVLVMPEDMSLERRYILKAYGAEVVLTPAVEGMTSAVARAKALLERTPGAWMARQFDNPTNPTAHAESTALEVLEQTGGAIAAFVAGVGTGGTLTGVGRVLRERLGTQVKLMAVEPAGSAVLSGGSPGLHGIQGLGAGFVPAILERTLIDRVLTVSDVAVERMTARLAREEGLLVGPSAAANVHAAIEVAGTMQGNVVTMLCDSGERYLFLSAA